MDKGSLFSSFSLVAVYIYLYIGFYTFNQNKKSNIHRIFLSLCTSYAIWSFAYAFAYISNDKYIFSFWNKISAIGWCSFSSITLYLVLLITENKIVKNKLFTILIFSPAIIFYYMVVFLFSPGMNTSTVITNVFYIGNFIYNFSFLFISIIVLFLWGWRTNNKRIKKQSNILVLSSIMPFIVNLITQTILPMVGINKFPLMGQIYSLVMITGTYIVITKYKFLRLPEKFILEEIENKMLDMIIILNEKGEFVKISKHTLNMLGFEENELLKKNIGIIFDKNNKEKISIINMKQQDKQFSDVLVVKKNGGMIPVNISSMPIFDNKISDFLGVLIVMQDISLVYELRRKNAELQEKSIRDSLTKLYNHQYSMELIEKEVNKVKADENRKELSIMMLDIDKFKKVNDSYGHQFGDYVLKTVSNILLNTISSKGYVGRFGGEEFIIILPEIEINCAYIMGEKIRNKIEKYKFKNDYKLTISIGIKQYRNESYIELIKITDDLLYKAKQNGRNRIEYS